MNLLFVCSRNKRRSLTAETIYKNHNEHTVRSAGTEESARIQVNEKMLHWADVVFVMEKRHRQRLEQKFFSVISTRQLIILDIPDEYEYMDEELIEMLKDAVNFLKISQKKKPSDRTGRAFQFIRTQNTGALSIYGEDGGEVLVSFYFTF